MKPIEDKKYKINGHDFYQSDYDKIYNEARVHVGSNSALMFSTLDLYIKNVIDRDMKNVFGFIDNKVDIKDKVQTIFKYYNARGHKDDHDMKCYKVLLSTNAIHEGLIQLEGKGGFKNYELIKAGIWAIYGIPKSIEYFLEIACNVKEEEMKELIAVIANFALYAQTNKDNITRENCIKLIAVAYMSYNGSTLIRGDDMVDEE